MRVVVVPKMVFRIVFAIKYFMSTSFLVPSRFCFVLDLSQRRFKAVAVEEWVLVNKKFLFQSQFLIVNPQRQQMLCGRIIYINFVSAYLSIWMAYWRVVDITRFKLWPSCKSLYLLQANYWQYKTRLVHGLLDVINNCRNVSSVFSQPTRLMI